jgi:uncharacterized protein YbaP (TraB family)
MRKNILLLAILSLSLSVSAQKKKLEKKDKPTPLETEQPKKYPSLLWEITGNGLSKPSYLFGTMHVSNKLVFNLGDTFYYALKNVDAVALEQDPNLWQEEYTKQESYGGNNMFSNLRSRFSQPNDRLSINTFAIGNYDEKLKAALSLEAQMVNGMMYRTDPNMEDFQEETYLDMYIYRAGKKFNKIVTGVENYKETNKLVKKAYMALYKERLSKRKSNNYRDNYTNAKRQEEAYRTGNLDLIDSIEMANVQSDGFQENFMYKRNDIQVNSIDTILKKHSLFVGVGAAHLPGERGVIELLRKKGYILRPILMGNRNSDEKEKLEKIRVPLNFQEQWMEDSSFSIKVPGNKLYRYQPIGGLNMVQYADMANGSYYMITRIKTNASILGQSKEIVSKKIDSLLYENIPGKIIEKKSIDRQGYKGYEISNRTRRGDVQRYNIYILPDEVVLLKVAGVSDYVLEEKQLADFFASINFKHEEKTSNVQYQPPYKGFSVSFPDKPFYLAEKRNDKDRSEWTATDEKGNAYLLVKTSLHQYDFIEEDTFDLSLMEESFTHSKFIGNRLSRKFSTWKGYPSLDASYKHTDGTTVAARYILHGNDYYLLATKYKNKNELQPFFETFAFTPFEYNAIQERKDSVIGFTVKSPVFYETKKVDDDDEDMSDMYRYMQDDDETSLISSYLDTYHSKTIGNDSTGERIYLTSVRLPSYYYVKANDSGRFLDRMFYKQLHDSDYTVYSKKQWINNKQWRMLELELRDTGSSRSIIGKSFYKDGIMFQLLHAKDTLSSKSSFVQSFFETFEPADTFKFRNPFIKQSEQFFADYFSEDSVKSKKAKLLINASFFDSADLPQAKKAIAQLNWNSKKYLETKRKWIGILGSFKDAATTAYLSELYIAAKDTSDLQNTVLDALLKQKTSYSFETFRSLLLKDPPGLVSTGNNSTADYSTMDFMEDGPRRTNNRRYYQKWSTMYDSLQLAASIIPDMIDLVVIDDYKPLVTDILVTTVDSGFLKANQYRQYFNRLLLESKQMLKKQLALEDRAAIEKEAAKKDKPNSNTPDDYYSRGDRGNQKLLDYTVLLMPFNDNSDVQMFLNKLITTKDKDLQYGAALLLLRNKQPVHDSILLNIAERDSYRNKLYSALEEANLLDKFPAKYKTQESLARGMFYTNRYRKVDSLLFLEKQLVTTKNNKGWVYLYKYKQMKDDTKWQIAYSGLQPFDQKEIKAEFDEDDDADERFFGMTTEYYEEKKDNKATFQKIIKEKLYQQRKSASYFYNGKNADAYDSYLPDAVKAGRRY